MSSGSCHCTYDESVGSAFTPCINKRCELNDQVDKCFSMLRHGYGLVKGCVSMTRCWSTQAINFDKNIMNCCDGNLCNEADDGSDLAYVRLDNYDDLFELQLNQKGHVKPAKVDRPYSTAEIAAMIAVPLSIVFIVLTILFIIMARRKRKAQQKQAKAELLMMNEEFDMQNLNLSEFTTSGSGAGLPLLIQRTIARQIVLGECVGKGRFGAVHRGTWHDQYVAVKIFATTEEASWFREAQIYQTTMLRHENVLGFIAADNKDTGACTQLWLVTEYHSNGSLYDYLQDHTLTISETMKMVFSIVNGLTHLHMEVMGTQGKPAMAHRDLKTKNILVKASKVCCVADLGLTVLHTSINNKVDVPTSTRTGTRRYQAPELLNDTIDLLHFDSYRRADVYALGLCIWEVCRRTVVDGNVDTYELPFFDCVDADPSHEEMRQAVCVEQKRPCFSESWNNNKTIKYVSKVMRECWYTNGAARLTSLRIKKNFLAWCRELDIPLQ